MNIFSCNTSNSLLCFPLTESSEGPLPLSGLSGPPVLEVFATCHDICVLFNWPVYFSFACKIVVDLIKGDIYLLNLVIVVEFAVTSRIV